MNIWIERKITKNMKLYKIIDELSKGGIYWICYSYIELTVEKDIMSELEWLEEKNLIEHKFDIQFHFFKLSKKGKYYLNKYKEKMGL